jgi:methionine-rich copper-binding protein CopC
MKSQFIFLLALILLTTLASATVTQTYNAFESTIDQSGILKISLDPVNSFSSLGFICEDSSCLTVSGKFSPEKNSELDNSLTVSYPTNLQSQFGYGIFFFKEGFIPHELTSNFFGNGNAGSFDISLSKKEVCSSELKALQLPSSIIEEQEIEIEILLSSPIEHSGPINYIPLEIKEQFETLVSYKIEIKNTDKNEIVFLESGNKIIGFSGVDKQVSEWTSKIGEIGNYQVKVSTSVQDEKCLSSKEKTLIRNFEVLPKPLSIDSTTTSPSLPLQNNGSSQQILLDFSSNFFPVSVIFNLKNSNNLIDTQGPISRTSSTESITYNLPSNLEEGTYNLEAVIARDNDQVTIQLGEIIIEKNKEEPANNQTNLQITNITTSPSLPLINNRSEQEITLTFNSNIFPLAIVLGLFDSQENLIDLTDISIISNNTSQPVISYTIPADLSEGSYFLVTSIETLEENPQIFESVLGTIIVQKTVIPEIDLFIISPESRIYSTTNIEINLLAINFESIWFSIDTGSSEIYTSTIQKNLSEGQHTLTAFANNSQGKIVSREIIFSVNIVDDKDNNEEDNDDNNGNNDGSSSSSKRRTTNSFLNPPDFSISPAAFLEYYENEETISLEGRAQKQKIKEKPILSLVILLETIFILLVLFLIIILASRRK